MEIGNKVTASPGIYFALWRIVYFVGKYKEIGQSFKDIFNAIGSTGSLGGTIPIHEGIRLGQKSGVLDLISGRVVLTQFYIDEILPTDTVEISFASFMRKIIAFDIKSNKYRWLSFFNPDFQIFKISIPSEWIDILDSALLLESDSADVIEWWHGILNFYREYDQSRNVEIGDIGEKLSIDFEIERLRREGFQYPEKYVTWVARISDEYGYDIRSIRGRYLLEGNKPLESIMIEVKSTSLKNEKSFSFFVSKNEWSEAIKNLEKSFFFCWVGIDIVTKQAEKGPFIIPASEIKDHFPLNRSTLSEWTKCRFTLDLTKISKFFP